MDDETKDLTIILNNPIYIDNYDNNEECKIKCHSFILCARSSYFSSMISSGLKESLNKELKENSEI